MSDTEHNWSPVVDLDDVSADGEIRFWHNGDNITTTVFSKKSEGILVRHATGLITVLESDFQKVGLVTCSWHYA